MDNYIKFTVDSNAIVENLLNGEIMARVKSRGDKQKRREYKEYGIINSTKAIRDFIKKYGKKMVEYNFISDSGDNIFGELLPISSKIGSPEYEASLNDRLTYLYSLPEDRIDDTKGFFLDMEKLSEDSDIQDIARQTEKYKNSIERNWKLHEPDIMTHIFGILGQKPKKIGKVEAFIMYPNFDTHRSYQANQEDTYLFYGKRNGKDSYKTLAHLAHQVVHRPMFPYKASMTQKDKERFHAFIKFLTDKEIYSFLSGKSPLEITTVKENPRIMGMVYPYWLGYKYRKDKNAKQKIAEEISRDAAYFQGLKRSSKKFELYKYYNFERLSPFRIAEFFKDKKYMTPYEFVEIDFDNKSQVYDDADAREDITL